MKINRIESLKHTALFTLLLFAGMLALSGITGLLPAEAQSEASPPATEFSGAQEVFAEAPQEIKSNVFSGFQPPLTGRITSPYGYRDDPFSGADSYHRGTDIAVPEGTAVTAVQKGTVIASAYNKTGGNYVILDHGNGTKSYYGHLQVRTVSRGDTVEQGDVIGRSGATGRVTGAHLHFQLTYNGRTVDPQRYLDLAAE